MPSSLTRIIAGFLAGALAVLIFHQGMYVLMQQMGLPLRGSPWNVTGTTDLWPELFKMAKLAPLKVPVIASQTIWGGLFGILFAYMINSIPGGLAIIKGLIFGMIFPMLLGSWLIVAYVKGTPLFAGAFVKDFNILALRNGFLLNGVAFGIGLGLLYPILAGMIGGRDSSRH